MEYDPNELVELGIFPSEMLAQLFKNRLEEEGIDAIIFSTASDGLGFLSSSTFPHGGAQIKVKLDDLNNAKALLEEFRDEHDLMDELEIYENDDLDDDILELDDDLIDLDIDDDDDDDDD